MSSSSRKMPTLNSAATPASVQFGSVNLVSASTTTTRTTTQAPTIRAWCPATLVMCSGVAESPV